MKDRDTAEPRIGLRLSWTLTAEQVRRLDLPEIDFDPIEMSREYGQVPGLVVEWELPPKDLMNILRESGLGGDHPLGYACPACPSVYSGRALSACKPAIEWSYSNARWEHVTYCYYA